jgi:hypothetical protein
MVAGAARPHDVALCITLAIGFMSIIAPMPQDGLGTSLPEHHADAAAIVDERDHVSSDLDVFVMANGVGRHDTLLFDLRKLTTLSGRSTGTEVAIEECLGRSSEARGCESAEKGDGKLGRAHCSSRASIVCRSRC